MSPTIVSLFVYCLINLSWCAPAMDSINVTSIDSVTSTQESVSSEIIPTESQPSVTINLNCSCIISTSNLKNSELVIPGLVVNGKSDYRCNQKSFTDCDNVCLSKRNEPIFNIDSQSIGINITNGVYLDDYLCNLKAKGDTSTMVSITTQMDCTEKSTNFELFNSQSNSVYLSPLSSPNCPDSVTVTTTIS